MPYHVTRDNDGQIIDFAAVYDRLIAPSIVAAGMTPLRADEDPQSRGVFQKSMFERLVLCEFAVGDLSSGNPNVYYELGVRHALRPYSTILLFRDGFDLPLDIAHDAALKYGVNAEGKPLRLDATREKLISRLRSARDAEIDSPVYQLVTGLPVPELDHERIDSFRQHAERDEQLRQRLEDAAREGLQPLRTVEATLGPLSDLELRTAMSLLVAYRSASAYEDLVRVIEGLAKPLSRVELVRQQYAWALNRCGRDRQAERVATDLATSRPSSETYGLLGRIYKDRWDREASESRRRGLLGRAIEVYLKGFETDWRDPYPGLNAITLMALRTPPDPRLEHLLPIVAYARDRRLARTDREPDYWDHATDLGLAVLSRDKAGARHASERALALTQDRFEPETTARDLGWVADARAANGEDVEWVREIIRELNDVDPL